MTSNIESALMKFYQQFTPNIYPSNAIPLNPPTPYIIFQTAQPNAFAINGTIVNFNIFDNATNTSNINRICDAISAKIPSLGGARIPVYKNEVWKWYNPVTELWTEFNIDDFLSMVIWYRQEFPDIWQKTDFTAERFDGEQAGFLVVRRNAGFLQNMSLPVEEFGWVAKLGTLELISYIYEG